MASLAGPQGGRIAFLGDDDLVSICLGATAPKLDIVVLEIDSDLCRLIEKVAHDFRLNLEVVCLDLFQPIPVELLESFDFFVADPFPTEDASFELSFIAQGLKLLKRGTRSRGVVTWAPSHKAPGFREVLTAALMRHQLRSQPLGVTCEYELIDGEFTAVEHEALRRLDPFGAAISHTKEHLLIKRGSSAISPTLSLDAWATRLERHDLTARVGARVRWGHSESIDTSSGFSSANQGSGGTVNPKAMLLDLFATQGVSKADLENESPANLLDRLASDSDFRNEAGVLSAAAANGPTTYHDSWAPELELYLLARLYESYFRPPSLLFGLGGAR